MSNKKEVRVEVVDGLSSVEIENEINAFLYKRGRDVEVQNISITTSMFVDESGKQCCYYVGLIQYLK